MSARPRPQSRPPGGPKVDPGGPCARYVAGQRVVPLARSWNGRQKIVRWFIHDKAIQEPSVREASYQGYVLEQTRVLVTTLNYNVLPVLLGGLAATAAAIRSHRDKARCTRVGAARLGAETAAGAAGRVPGRNDRLVHQPRSQQRPFRASREPRDHKPIGALPPPLLPSLRASRPTGFSIGLTS